MITPAVQYDLANAFGEDTDFAQVAAVSALALVRQVTAPAPGPGCFEISGAEHGALLNPAQGPTTQIVTQAIVFLAGNPTLQVPAGTIISTGLRAQTTTEVAPENPADYSHVIRF